MNCNCTKACSIPYCITELEIGIVEPGLTDLVIQFTDTITGRVKKLTGIAPQTDGLLIVDVTTINAFFSPNFTYELKVLFSDESGCETVPIIVDDQTVNCINFNFVLGESEKGVIVLDGQSSQYMQITHSRGNFDKTITFTPTFTGQYIAYWGDGTESVLYSGIANSHTYVDAGTYTTKIRGAFDSMTGISLNADLIGIVMPPVNSITDFNVGGNNMTSDYVNNVLGNLNQNGYTNGTLIVTQSPAAPPTGFGVTAKADLIAKGWSVTTD